MVFVFRLSHPRRQEPVDDWRSTKKPGNAQCCRPESMMSRCLRI
jgi:hypothetical protein